MLIGLVVGALPPLQFGVNTTLAKALGSPLRGGLISFFVGTVAILIAVALFAPRGWLPLSKLAGLPWWVYTGGLMGAVFVLTSIVLTPRLGAVLVMLFIVGQLVSGLVLEQFGWLGYPHHPLNAGRVVGVLLLLGGVVLVRFA